MYKVVVKKFYEVGLVRVKFTGTYDECVSFLSSHRWGYYELLNKDNRLTSYILG